MVLLALVCYLFTEQWNDFQNRIKQYGGQITQKHFITIPINETKPQCIVIGTRQQYLLQGDFLVILPIQIYQYQQYAFVFVDPFTRGNINDSTH